MCQHSGTKLAHKWHHLYLKTHQVVLSVWLALRWCAGIKSRTLSPEAICKTLSMIEVFHTCLVSYCIAEGCIVLTVSLYYNRQMLWITTTSTIWSNFWRTMLQGRFMFGRGGDGVRRLSLFICCTVSKRVTLLGLSCAIYLTLNIA